MGVNTAPVLVLVAASSAPSAIKDVAEYVCNGTNDQDKLTSAFSSVANGGLVVPTPGLFQFSAPAIVPIGTGAQLDGSGWGTIFQLQAGAGAYAFQFSTSGGNVTGARFANFAIDCNGGAGGAGAGSGGIYAKGAVGCVFSHIRYLNAYDAGLWCHEISGGVPGHHNHSIACLYERTVSIAGHNQGIRWEASDENWSEYDQFSNLGGAGGEPYGIKDWSGINHIVHPTFVGGEEAIRGQDCSGTQVDSPMFDGVGRDCIHITGSGWTLNGGTYSGGGQSSAGTYSHIVLDGTGGHSINGGVHSTDATAGRLRSFIRELGASSDRTITAGKVFTVNGALGTGKVERNAQTGNRYFNNIGYATANSGTTAFGAAATSVTSIAHGLDVTPAAKDFSLQFVADPLAAGHAWVSSITSTTFTLNIKAAPGGAGTTVGWQVEVL